MSDWGSDDETPSTNGGFGGGSNGFGFGRGRGMGRGAFGADSGEAEPMGFGSRPGGFGNRSGGFGGGDSRGGSRGSGFGSRNSEENTNGASGGFGSGRRGGGFGSRGGFGASNDDDEPRGGGFGEKKSLGRGRGNRTVTLSNGPSGFHSRGSSGGACYKCGGEGHFSRECPQSGGGRSGGSGCYKCGEEGHMARDCPNAESSGGRSGGGGGGGSCYKCGQEGHFARECPNSESSGGGGGGSRGCYKCGQDGHMARDCPEAGGSGSGGGSRSKACFKCHQEGHMSRECPEADNGDVGDGERKKTEIYVPPPPPDTEEEIFRSVEAGINFSNYENIPVEVSGENAPKNGISSFDQAELTETIRGNVRKANYTIPTPIQKWAIPIILSGRDLMGCAQTGSGKTAAFLLPILNGIIRDNLLESGSGFGGPQKPAAIIVGPTRELVSQIHMEARKFARSTIIRPVVVYGGTSVGYQSSEVEKGAHIVAGTPGRLLDFVGRGKISLENVKYLVLDEADRMLDMGFEPEIRKLVETFNLPPKGERQTLMFSATFPEEIQRLAQEFLNNYLFVTVGRVGGANSDITQSVIKIGRDKSKRDVLVEILNESGTDRTLVFLERKRQADFLAAYLSQSQFPATSIHGDRLQREREEALRDFKTGRAPILIATSVAARGLDIPGVMHVINYDLPNHIEEYVHRIGRTGRCGNLGKATSFFDPATDKDIARQLVKTLAESQQNVPEWLEDIAQENFGSGFQGAGGAFGGRDTRDKKFNNNNNEDSGVSNGYGACGADAGDNDEDWN